VDPAAIDPDAFDAFEASGWNDKADGYERFLGAVTSRLADPLLDAAATMVALAGRLHPELEFRQADVYGLPFPDASFDAVVGNFLIMHLGRPEQAVAELARVMRPRRRARADGLEPPRPGLTSFGSGSTSSSTRSSAIRDLAIVP
jgi:SAM-dependent methyltransferase